MFTFKISTGEMFQNGGLLAKGYSGQPPYVNRPEDCDLHALGPIPQGKYHIGPPCDTAKHGPHVMALTAQEGTDTLGRSGFLIHGDSKLNPGYASYGCIILPRDVRDAISASGETELEVIA